MAIRGNLYLNNKIIQRLCSQITQNGENLITSLYEQWKNTYVVSKSIAFRGEGAESLKNYLSQGALNIIAETMDVVSDISMFIQLYMLTFTQYESNNSGTVEEAVLSYIKNNLTEKKNVFSTLCEDIRNDLAEAEQYMSINLVPAQLVESDYTNLFNSLEIIKNNLYYVEDSLLKVASELHNRIIQLKTLVQNTLDFCYNGGQRLNDNAKNLSGQEWYYKGTNLTLGWKLDENPFEYVANATTDSEDQWVKGWSEDTYIYGGYSVFGGSYEAGINNNVAFANAAASILTLNGYAQLTDYVKGQYDMKFVYAEGDAKAGWSEDYRGAHIAGGVGFWKNDASLVLGTEAVNLKLNGNLDVLCADGKIACEINPLTGEGAIGVKGKATLAEATGSIGTSFFSINANKTDPSTGKKTAQLDILGISVGGGPTAGVGFALWGESTNIWHNDIISINATTIDVDAAALLDINGKITVPTIYSKYTNPQYIGEEIYKTGAYIGGEFSEYVSQKFQVI